MNVAKEIADFCKYHEEEINKCLKDEKGYYEIGLNYSGYSMADYYNGKQDEIHIRITREVKKGSDE